MTKVEERVMELYNSGMLIEDIAKEIKYAYQSTCTVICRLRKQGLIGYRASSKGGRRSKEQQYILAAQLYCEGKSNEYIADAIGIKPKSVGQYLSIARKRGYKVVRKVQEPQPKKIMPEGTVCCCKEVSEKCIYGYDGRGINLCNYILCTHENRPNHWSECTSYKEGEKIRCSL